MSKILNIAAGNMLPIKPLTNLDFLVNLDLNYFKPVDVGDVEDYHRKHKDDIKWSLDKPVITYVNHDVYDFLEKYTEKFDEVVMYRFLEHVPKVKVLYFLYILAGCIRIGGTVDVIVPDYTLLAKRILKEDVYKKNFEAEDIITTFELLNEPYCPHASIWTEDRAHYFFELEKRFKIKEMQFNFNFDGRNIYLRFQAERVQ